MAKLNHFWKWQIGRFLIFWCLKRGRWKNLAFHDVAQGLAPVLLLNHAFKECLWVVLKCLKTSASVCWCLFKSFLSFGVWRGASIDMDYILGCQRCLRVFLETYSMRDSVRHFGPTLKGKIFFQPALLRHQNIKTSLSTTSKNDWVLAFFLFFMSVREKLQFTVSL